MKPWTLCLLLLVAGCGTSTAASTGSGDSGVDDAGGVCCTPSATPACCMSFGGWALSADQCGGQECDGFQLPTMITKDLHGCDVWTGGSGPVCGHTLSPDSGADGGVCLAGATCTPGQTCSISCGIDCQCDSTGVYLCSELPCEGGASLVDSGTEAGVVDGGTD